MQYAAGLLFTELLRLVHYSLLQFCPQQHCRGSVTTGCSGSVSNSAAAVLSQQFAADLTTVCSSHVTTSRNMPRELNASDMRPVDDIPQQADNSPAATCANLAVYYGHLAMKATGHVVNPQQNYYKLYKLYCNNSRCTYYGLSRY